MIHMSNSFFKYIPSCSDCEYATLYIPYFSYPHSDPYCSKGHGKCEVDKFCSDFRLINSHYCYECVNCIDDNYCKKHDKEINKNDESCVYFERVL